MEEKTYHDQYVECLNKLEQQGISDKQFAQIAQCARALLEKMGLSS